MRSYYPLLLCFLIDVAQTIAQPDFPKLSFEAGLGAGGMNCLTDLGGNKGRQDFLLRDINANHTRAAATLYAVLKYKSRFALRFGFYYGSVSGADYSLKKTDPDLTGRYGRNLSFRSGITEAHLAIEWRVFQDWWYGDDGVNIFKASLLGGLGYFHFNPRTRWNNQWVNLYGLRLEGQGFEEYPHLKAYRRTQVNIPVGIIVSRGFTNGTNIGIELIYRYLFTDYLDDVSGRYIDPSLFYKYLDPVNARLATQLQYRTREIMNSAVPVNQPRGNPKKNDAYFSLVLKLGVNLFPLL
ncbi:MAG: hypothetical protein ABWZ25_07950 [Chitinophagaceae bacterium]